MAVAVVILNLIYARLNSRRAEEAEEDAELFT
jgi:hypothetical protein